MSQTLGSMGKNEFRIICAASPDVAFRRSSGRSGERCRQRVVDNEVHLDLVFDGLVHDFNGVLDHFRSSTKVSISPSSSPSLPYLFELSTSKSEIPVWLGLKFLGVEFGTAH